MSSERESSMKLIMFNGKADSFDNWEFAFMARAVNYNYDGILAGEDTVPTQAQFKAVSPTTTDDVEKKIRSDYKANSLAFSHLVNSMEQKGEVCAVAIGILKSCMTKDLPRGDACKAMTELRNYYCNKSVATVQSLLSQYHGSAIKKDQDPSEYIYELENLRAKIADVDRKRAIDEESMVLRLLNTLPSSYSSIVEDIEKDLNKGVTVPISEIRNLLHLKWQRIMGRRANSGTTGGSGASSNTGAVTRDETVLYAGGFKGKCSKCGKYGHKGSECRTKTTGTSTTSGGGGNTSGTINCNYCKKDGHMKYNCPVLKEKEAKGGTGGTGSSGGGGGSNDRAEVVLIVVERITALKLCDRCNCVGHVNHSCQVCYVGKYILPIPSGEDPTLGQCEECSDIGPIGTYCDNCEDMGLIYHDFDTDSVHLDVEAEEESDEDESEISVPSEDKDLIFDSMLKDMATNTSVVYPIKTFLKHVARRLHRSESDEIRRNLREYSFVQRYYFDLVNLGIATVEQLVAKWNHVNQLLLAEEHMVPFDSETMDCIMVLVPIWFNADYRYKLNRNMRLPLTVLSQLDPPIVLKLDNLFRIECASQYG